MGQGTAGTGQEIGCNDNPSGTIEHGQCRVAEISPKDKCRVDEHIAVKLYDILQARREFFTDGIFGDPAWIILLKLFIAEKARETVRLVDVCTVADLPASAASRWMKILVQNGHVNGQGEGDGAVFTLTPQAHGKLATLFAGFEDRLP